MTPVPNLADYDLVLVNSSAGKDSQAMLTYLVELAAAQQVSTDRFLVVYANLGRVVWKGTKELAAEHAAAYGLRFAVVGRAEDLLDQVVTRHETLRAKGDTTTPAWPSSTARYCTSDQKTSQVAKLMTAEVTAWRARTGETRPMRILNCLGLRAQESAARAKKVPLHRDSASNGKREVTRWLPIFTWTARKHPWGTERDDVWTTIKRSGLRWHAAYDQGMPRLSCVLCVLGGRQELVLAARLNPELAQDYLAVEQRIGHTFRQDVSMAQIVAESLLPEQREPAADEPLTLFECGAA
jgi:3'-phosphoadenosine 5'-phosphosulfate sulfotransferase (PAPS reductase)/FAD synthetase